jgi:Cu/Ag efflux protein CusF
LRRFQIPGVSIVKLLSALTTLVVVLTLQAQDTTPSAQAKPSEHVLGTVTAVDPGNHTVTVKEDGASAQTHVIDLSNTKTLLKVPPTAKDLKTATRITAGDLAVGDRVDVRGSKAEGGDATGIAARSVVLMSARDLEQHHQAEASAWQKSTPGTVVSVDAAAQKLTVTSRTPEGPKPVTVDAGGAQFTRYSPETPKTPKQSAFNDIQPGDQVKIIGEKSSDGTAITAQKIYSGTFKSVAGTLVSASPDGKSIVVKDLGTKQPVTVLLSGDASVRKLPPMMANMLARRFNPDYKAPEGASGAGGSGTRPGGSGASPAMGAKTGETATSAGPGGPDGGGQRPGGWNGPSGAGAPGGRGPGGPGMRGGNGDLSQMLERIPTITLAELKPGDALVISGSPSAENKSTLLASNVIAGVEPIFQSASPRQAQSLGDWGNSLGGGAMDMAGGQP